MALSSVDGVYWCWGALWPFGRATLKSRGIPFTELPANTGTRLRGSGRKTCSSRVSVLFSMWEACCVRVMLYN